MKTNWDENTLLVMIRECVTHELPRGSPTPKNNDDLVKSGLLDSMGWVGVLSSLEKELRVRNFASTWPEGEPQSIEGLVRLARESLAKSESASRPSSVEQHSVRSIAISIGGWGCALGTMKINAAQIESQFALPAGTISERAGIRSVARVAASEDEISLGQAAATQALETSDLDAGEIDLIVGCSTTFLELPSFAAALHSRLLLLESCTALDVGGACVGLVNALATAKAFLSDGIHRAALVVASEVHSRWFASSIETGEFRGLFGDGACAFVLRSFEDAQAELPTFQIGDFVSACNGAMSSALRIGLQGDGTVGVAFNGEALGKAAVTTLNEVIGKLESLSGAARSEVEYFAFHEPNPRLVAILAQRANVAVEKFSHTAENTGNLGSVTCGVNLCTALTRARADSHPNGRRIIFVAAVGPGVLWSGTFIEISGQRN